MRIPEHAPLCASLRPVSRSDPCGLRSRGKGSGCKPPPREGGWKEEQQRSHARTGGDHPGQAGEDGGGVRLHLQGDERSVHSRAAGVRPRALVGGPRGGQAAPSPSERTRKTSGRAGRTYPAWSKRCRTCWHRMRFTKRPSRWYTSSILSSAPRKPALLKRSRAAERRFLTHRVARRRTS